MVFSGLYPIDTDRLQELRDALEKLKLNDAALLVRAGDPRRRSGFGFRCGFLGLLHMEIVQERLEREFDVDLIRPPPTSSTESSENDGETIDGRQSRQDCPTRGHRRDFEEPIVKAISSCRQRATSAHHGALADGGELLNAPSICRPGRGSICLRAAARRDHYRLLRQAEERHPRLRLDGLRTHRLSPARLVKLDILVNAERSSAVVHRASRRALSTRPALCEKLRIDPPPHVRNPIPGRDRQRSSPARRSAVRKNVTAKCYGGDITRKRKLLEKQKEGKKRMKQSARSTSRRRPSWRRSRSTRLSRCRLWISSISASLISLPAGKTQQDYAAKRRAGECGDVVLFCEHPPTLSLGKRTKDKDLGMTPAQWRARGVEVIAADRGGGPTYHGPGQLLIYPVIKLSERSIGIKRFVALGLEAIAAALRGYGIAASSRLDEPGVWTVEGGGAKIAAVGLAVHAGVTEHGFSVNIGGDTAVYSLFSPCGHRGLRVASLMLLRPEKRGSGWGIFATPLFVSGRVILSGRPRAERRNLPLKWTNRPVEIAIPVRSAGLLVMSGDLQLQGLIARGVFEFSEFFVR